MNKRHHHRPAALFLLLLLLTLSAAGCGNKGDLYLPDDSAETAEEADESEQDR